MRKFKRRLKLEKILFGIIIFILSIFIVFLIMGAIFIIATGQAKYGIMTKDALRCNPIAIFTLAIIIAIYVCILISFYRQTKEMEEFIAKLESEQEEKNKGNNDDEKRKEEVLVHDEKEEK